MDRSSRPLVFKTSAIDHSAKPPNNVPRLGLEPRPHRLRVWYATINAIEAFIVLQEGFKPTNVFLHNTLEECGGHSITLYWSIL